MGGTEIGDWLQDYASQVQSTNSIVEVGVWLGAGTYNLCKGVTEGNNAPIYCYDRWTASKSESTKAKAYGLSVEPGSDLLQHVKSYLAPFEDTVDITFTKGEIFNLPTFAGPEIGLYIDDASKQPNVFNHVMNVFKPKFKDNAILVLMDFHFFEKHPDRPELRCQYEYMQKRPREFEYIKRSKTTSTAVFRYHKS